MRQDLTKSQRRRIRELAGIAYDRELSRELTVLEKEFARWRSGAITAQDLDQRIHEFHQGPNRQLFTTYTGGAIELAVAAAIANGVMRSRGWSRNAGDPSWRDRGCSLVLERGGRR